MTPNARKHRNPIRVFTLAQLAILLIFAGTLGLSYVWLKVRQYDQGRRIREKETALLSIREENQHRRATLAYTVSLTQLQSQLDSGEITLARINDKDILRLGAATPVATVALRDTPQRSDRMP